MQSENHKTSVYRLPSIGKIWHTIIVKGGLIQLNQTLASGTDVISPKRAKEICDALNDYASEQSIPHRTRCLDFLEEITRGIPSGDRLQLLLMEAVEMMTQHHKGLCLSIPVESATDSMQTRYVLTTAPIVYSILVFLHMGLRHIYGTEGSWLSRQPIELLGCFCSGLQTGQKTPISRDCFRNEAQDLLGDSPNFTDLESRWVDRTALSRWYQGEVSPSLDKLLSFYAKVQEPGKLDPVTKKNFEAKTVSQCYANFLDQLLTATHAAIPRKLHAKFWYTIAPMLARYDEINPPANPQDSEEDNLSDEDHSRTLLNLIGPRMARISRLCHAGANKEQPEDADELDQAAVAYGQYFSPNRSSGIIAHGLGLLLDATNLSESNTLENIVQLHDVKARFSEEYPDISTTQAGVLDCVKARIVLLNNKQPAKNRIHEAAKLYVTSFEAARNRAGYFTKSLITESLGCLCWLWRRDQVSYKHQINRMFNWWDLMALGNEFDHEILDRRIELAASKFESNLSSGIIDLISTEIPELKRTYIRRGNHTFSTMEEAEAKSGKQIRTNRLKDFLDHQSNSARDNSPLMEALAEAKGFIQSDDTQNSSLYLTKAEQLIRRGADLNVSNSTNDTAITYAFSCCQYDLVLQMLRRDKDPVTNETLTIGTKTYAENALSYAICKGQLEILKELASYGPKGIRHPLNFDSPLPNEVTPLGLAVEIAANSRMTAHELAERILSTMNEELNSQNQKLMHEIVVHAKELHPPSNEDAMNCLKFIIQQVDDVDRLVQQNTTALLLTAQHGLNDAALQLLKANANVNHSNELNVTPLYYALRDNNVELARMLLDWGAQTTVRVPNPAQGSAQTLIPINQLPMSPEMRAMIPFR
ncbi:ankyrin repeat domain-containing protein [Coraliomargarita akajimensis]|uniref:Ankyrin n=1 Tax=Coraliomargarita akajimensis (strain DSM 45221 / IAM 15411 / JCM 23193 / KCTC 12865 / 04OKA010-24) TaxID=583355 RepID=D5EID5_CORAD|nr:ankyrin repeat domain-containing protein [Coraliomargarita akajimensis]ADE54201.1 Ankyrin [Coraliomargarita akajimensis DSM 45221]